MNKRDIYLPYAARIKSRSQESADIFTLTLEFCDAEQRQAFQFLPGQFNMLYLFGVGEVAISIVSDPKHPHLLSHTIRRVGRVTQGLSLLKVGESVGIRGPFGRGWPLRQAKGKNVLIMTGGLGCAPSVSMINYIMNRRHEFKRLTILQGVKHSDDLIFRKQYEAWQTHPDTQVLLAADMSTPNWPGHTGLITELLNKIDLPTDDTICLMCGPEAMFIAAIKRLLKMGLSAERIFLSLERNMECAVGHCGHCQFGAKFICKDGPVFACSEIQHLLGRKGF